MTAVTDFEEQAEHPQPKARKRWPWVLLALAVLAVGVWLVQRTIAVSAGTKRGAHIPPIPVAVGQARRADIPVLLDGLGTATASRTITVRSRVDGQLDRVAFAEGQEVRAGDVLAEIARASVAASFAPDRRRQTRPPVDIAMRRRQTSGDTASRPSIPVFAIESRSVIEL
jgi:multidrug efflux system membrane fusion protein